MLRQRTLFIGNGVILKMFRINNRGFLILSGGWWASKTCQTLKTPAIAS